MATPEVIRHGEIRDEETAQIAIQCHVVLSTLHTNDAAGAIARLRSFGVGPTCSPARNEPTPAQRSRR